MKMVYELTQNQLDAVNNYLELSKSYDFSDAIEMINGVRYVNRFAEEDVLLGNLKEIQSNKESLESGLLTLVSAQDKEKVTGPDNFFGGFLSGLGFITASGAALALDQSWYAALGFSGLTGVSLYFSGYRLCQHILNSEGAKISKAYRKIGVEMGSALHGIRESVGFCCIRRKLSLDIRSSNLDGQLREFDEHRKQIGGVLEEIIPDFEA